MDKRRIKIATKVHWIPINCRIYIWPSTARVFEGKYISGRGNFSFYKPTTKKLAQKNISNSLVLGFKAERFSLHLTKYTMKLNSLSHDTYLSVIWIQFNKSFLTNF